MTKISFFFCDVIMMREKMNKTRWYYQTSTMHPSGVWMFIFSFFVCSLLNKYGEIFPIGCKRLSKKMMKIIYPNKYQNIFELFSYFIDNNNNQTMLKFCIFIFCFLLHYTIAEVGILFYKSNPLFYLWSLGWWSLHLVWRMWSKW